VCLCVCVCVVSISEGEDACAFDGEGLVDGVVPGGEGGRTEEGLCVCVCVCVCVCMCE
jgi:hypothetical protein